MFAVFQHTLNSFLLSQKLLPELYDSCPTCAFGFINCWYYQTLLMLSRPITPTISIHPPQLSMLILDVSGN